MINSTEHIPPRLPDDERRRRRREWIMIPAIIFLVAVFTHAEMRIIRFDTDIPISNTILMFILVNVNLLLLILLLFLVFRNLVKLLYERRRKVMGSRLRTRLVMAFITLTLLPSVVLFFFSMSFIAYSFRIWLTVPVEQALEKTMSVGRLFYDHIEDLHEFFLERAAYQIMVRKHLETENTDPLSRYIQVIQKEFKLFAVEVYGKDFQQKAFAVDSGFNRLPYEAIRMEDLKTDIAGKSVRTFIATHPYGELIRTIGTVPFKAGPPDIKGYIVITTLLEQDLSLQLEDIARGFEEYQQTLLFKRPIQLTFYLSLSIVGLLVVFCAIWFGFYLAKSISVPIKDLAEGTRRLAEGDLNVHIQRVADDEIGSLVDSFNRMTEDLRTGREKLEDTARMLHEQNIEIEERRQYMEVVLKNVSAGVISLNAAGVITTFNTSAEKMLNLDAGDVIRKHYREVMPDEYRKLAEEVLEAIAGSGKDEIEMPLRMTIDGRPRSFWVHVNSLKDDTGGRMGVVMVVDDQTELERAQRMAAWREVARRIAHEVKNPLTPISLSAQRLKRKYSQQIGNPVFDECTRTIIDHVELIRNLVNEFSTFARFPGANPMPCNLVTIVEETIALYREGHPDITFEIREHTPIPPLNLDRQHMKQAMINLVDNAVASIDGKGGITCTLTHDVPLKCVRLEVADTGTGIPDEEKSRLFEPYFTTRKMGAGMGLGLTIVHDIIQDHGGSIRVEDNMPRGARFIIEFPA